MTKSNNPAGRKLERSSDVQLTWVLSLFVFLTVAVVSSPVARIALYLFPAMSFAVSMYTYVRSKPVYAALVCWLWILTPLVRRLVDWRVGFSPTALVLTAPILACFAPLPFLLFYWKRVLNRAVPVLVALSAIAYGVGVAVLSHNHLADVAVSLAFWSSPVCFALFICYHRSMAVEILGSFRSTFILALPVMALYALYAFFFLPPWDRLWMENANLVSIGVAAPLSFRVFGTLNNPQGLGAFLVIALLVTFHSSNRYKLFSVPIGLLTLSLTGARSAWLGFVVGLIYLVFHLPSRQRLQIAASAAIAFVVLLGALQTDAKRSVLDRFQSTTDPNDVSLNTRLRGYATLLPLLADQPYGFGLGYDPSKEAQGSEGLGAGDSAVISLIFSFGFLGTLVYLVGLTMLVRGSREKNTDERTPIIACVLALTAEAFFTNIVEGGVGFLVWHIAALCFVVTSEASIRSTQVDSSADSVQVTSNQSFVDSPSRS